jgi:hypothetical protein
MNISAHTKPDPKRQEEPAPRQPSRAPRPNPGGDGEEPARSPRREHEGDHGRRWHDEASPSRLGQR